MASKQRYTHRLRVVGSNPNDYRVEVGVSPDRMPPEVVADDDFWSLMIDIDNPHDAEWVGLSTLTRLEFMRVAKYNIANLELSRAITREDMFTLILSGVQNSRTAHLCSEAGARRIWVNWPNTSEPAPLPVATAEPSPEPTVTTTVTSAAPATDDAMSTVFGSLFDHIKVLVRSEVSDGLSDVVGRSDFDTLASDIRVTIKQHVDALSVPRTVVVQSPREPSGVTVMGTHRDYERLLQRTAHGVQQYFHGPAGTGKTRLAMDIARGLGMQYEILSCTSDMMRHDLFGFRDGHGVVNVTEVRRALEQGLLLIIDEVDNSSANLMGGLNLLTTHDEIAFPDCKVRKHPDFRLIVIGNTIGEGATSQYRGRNALDAAFLDRFTFANIELDETIETAGVMERLPDEDMALRWLMVVRQARRNVAEYGLRVMVTPRAAFDGATLLAIGEDIQSAIQARIVRGASADVASKLLAGTGYEAQ